MKLTKTRLREIIEEEIASLTLEVAPLPVKRPALGDVARVAGIEQSARGGAFSRPPKLTDEQEEMLSTLGHRLASGGSLHWEDIGNLTAFLETQNIDVNTIETTEALIEFLNGYEAFESAYTGASEDQRGREDREYS